MVDDTGVTDAAASSISVAGTGNTIMISGAAGHAIIVYDSMGRVVATSGHADADHRIEVPSPGVYFVNIVNVTCFKIVI